MASVRASTIAIFVIITLSQLLAPTIGFLFPDLKLHPDIRSTGLDTPRYRIAVIREEPYLFGNGSGFVPDLMQRIAQLFRNQNNGEELVYELVPVVTWKSLMSRVRSPRTLALGMVIPALELTSWPSRPLHSSMPTLYTTLKLVVPKRKVNDWSSTGDIASAINQMEELESPASLRGTNQLSERVKVVVFRGSPAEYLLVRGNAYRGPIHVVDTTDEAVSILLSSSDSTLLTDAVTADYIITKYPADVESVCPSRLAGSGSISYSFFGRDESMVNKLNVAIATLSTDGTLNGLYSKHFTGHLNRQSPHECQQ